MTAANGREPVERLTTPGQLGHGLTQGQDLRM